MGVHWALNAAKNYSGRVEIIDLRSLTLRRGVNFWNS